MYETIIERIKERLESRDLKAVIIPHISPDGDAAGSCSALWQVLDRVGIQAQLMTCDYIPDYLKWLKRIPDAISFQNRPKECKHWLHQADILFMLDHNTVAREGDLEPFVKEFKGEVIMIDHHPDPDDVTYRISDTSVSSTCELLYNVISRVGLLRRSACRSSSSWFAGKKYSSTPPTAMESPACRRVGEKMCLPFKSTPLLWLRG